MKSQTKPQAKHTPEPWELHKGYDQKEIHLASLYVGPQEGRQVARIFREDPEAVANARLITAAPDLLEAAILIDSVIVEIGDEIVRGELSKANCSNLTARPWIGSAVDKLRAAIEKAEGGK